jgi:hypothetical protein
MLHMRKRAVSLLLFVAGCAVGESAPVDAPEPLAGEGFRVLATTRTEPGQGTRISAGAAGVYVANAARGTITRVARGDQPPELVLADQSAPTSIVADAQAVYFLDQRSLGQLVGMGVDGSQRRVLSSAQTIDTAPLAADDGQVYWVPAHGPELMAVPKGETRPTAAKRLGAFADDPLGACGVRDLVAQRHVVYGVTLCAKDRVKSAQLVAIDGGSGVRRVIDSVAGSFVGLAVDDTFVYYGVFPEGARSGEIRRAARDGGSFATFVSDVLPSVAGLATDATTDRVYYPRGSEILAVPKSTGGVPVPVATIGSSTPGAAVMIQQIVVGGGGVYAQVGEIDGHGGAKSHVVLIEE